jgi:hypothetical protein
MIRTSVANIRADNRESIAPERDYIVVKLRRDCHNGENPRRRRLPGESGRIRRAINPIFTAYRYH